MHNSGFCSLDIDCIIAMASGNSFAALADNDDEVPNQASKKPQTVAGAIPHVSAAGQKGQGAGPRRADRQSGATQFLCPPTNNMFLQVVAPRESAAPRAMSSR
jgi:hypothetical protein